MTVRRGEVVLVAIPNQKARPSIVLTPEWLSRYSLDVSVVPLTTVARTRFPTRVELPAGEGGLNKTSWAKCDQVTTVPKTLLIGQPFGRVSPGLLEAIEAAVRLSLGL